MSLPIPSRPLGFRQLALIGAAASLFAAVPAFAQRPMPMPVKRTVPAQKKKIVIPARFAPPSGMCRIWIDGVPAEKQPAPTDCATAVKNRPLNARVIFSDEPPSAGKGKGEDDVEQKLD